MSRGLQLLQYVLLLAAAAAVILMVWLPGEWLKLLLTSLVLLIAGTAVSLARDQESLRKSVAGIHATAHLDEGTLTVVAEALWRRQSDPLERKIYEFEHAPTRTTYLAHARAINAELRKAVH